MKMMGCLNKLEGIGATIAIAALKLHLQVICFSAKWVIFLTQFM
jgi:hypothetical protein